MQTIIDDSRDTFTIINTFTVEHAKAHIIVEALKEFTEYSTVSMRGFVGASMHVSADRTRVVNYVQWASRVDFEAMFASPEAKAHMTALGAIASNVDPVVYRVAYVAGAESSHA